MLLNAVIIILREVVEASLLISLFLAFSYSFNLSKKWLMLGLPIGIISAIFYAFNIAILSQWQEGVGQEVINATIHICLYIILLLLVIFAFHLKNKKIKTLLNLLMFLGIVLASIREGSEIILYIQGFMTQPDLLRPILFGSAIGAGIGISLGVFFFYALVNFSQRTGVILGLILCLLVAGGMILQSTQLLAQADWLPSQYPLWDSSNLISEGSTLGQLLYALIGYESTPTMIQVVSYLSGLVSMILLAFFSSRKAQKVMQ
jgi:high-affinity iron transporter